MSLLARSLLVLLAVLSAPLAHAQADDPLSVRVRVDVQGENDVVLTTEARIFPITVRVEKKDWTNCKATRTPPFTEVFRGPGTRKIFGSSAEQRGQAWRCHVSTTWLFGDPDLSSVERCAFALPFTATGRSTVIQGVNGEPTHKGQRQHALDFRLEEGTPVLAARDGIVDYVLDDERDNQRPEGNEVLVLHADGSHTGYAHLQRGSVVVKPGQAVARGSMLARSGRTSSREIAPHVHFEVFASQRDSRLSVPFDVRLPDGSCRVPAEGERL